MAWGPHLWRRVGNWRRHDFAGIFTKDHAFRLDVDIFLVPYAHVCLEYPCTKGRSGCADDLLVFCSGSNFSDVLWSGWRSFASTWSNKCYNITLKKKNLCGLFRRQAGLIAKQEMDVRTPSANVMNYPVLGGSKSMVILEDFPFNGA